MNQTMWHQKNKSWIFMWHWGGNIANVHHVNVGGISCIHQVCTTMWHVCMWFFNVEKLCCA